MIFPEYGASLLNTDCNTEHVSREEMHTGQGQTLEHMLRLSRLAPKHCIAKQMKHKVAHLSDNLIDETP